MPEAEVVELDCCCNCNPCSLLTNKTFLRSMILISHAVTFGTVLSLQLESQPLDTPGLTAVERRRELATRSFQVYFLLFINGIGLLLSLLWTGLLLFQRASRAQSGSTEQQVQDNALIFRCRGGGGETCSCNCANWEFMMDLIVGMLCGIAFFSVIPTNPCQQADIKDMFGTYCSRLNSGIAFSLISCFFYVFVVLIDLKVCCCSSSSSRSSTLPPPATANQKKYPASHQPQVQSSARTGNTSGGSWFSWPRKNQTSSPPAQTVTNPPPYSPAVSQQQAPVKQDSQKKPTLYENITKIKVPFTSTKTGASSSTSAPPPPLPDRQPTAPVWPPNYQ